MDVKIVIACLISVLVLLIQEGNGWGRPNRFSHHRCRPYCPNRCRWGWNSFRRWKHCSFVCICGRGRRDVGPEGDSFVSPLPKSIDFYDRNEDGMITMEELANALEQTSDEVMEAFQYADTDTDGKLTKEEFRNGPFLFQED